MERSSSVTDEDIRRFQGLSKLRFLTLSGKGISDAGIVHLKKIPSLFQLRLVGTRITDAATEHLRQMPKLTRLALEDNNLIDEALRTIPRVETLVLRESGITDRGVAHLRGMTDLEGLLLLSETGITSASVDHLKKLQGLRHLNVVQTQIGAEAVDQLRDALPRCRIVSGPTGDPDYQLAEWVLQAGGKVSAKGGTFVEREIDALEETWRNAPFWITRISLSGIKNVSDSDLSRLSGVTALTHFDARGTDLSDQAVAHLTRLPMLTFVDLTDTNVSDEAVEALRRASPDCKIEYGSTQK